MAEEDKKPTPLFDNVIDSFRNGVVLDLRLKFAMDLLENSSLIREVPAVTPKEHAAYALEVATELFALGAERGLMKPLDDEVLWEQLIDHVRRVVSFNKAQQDEARRAQDQSITVGRHVSGALAKN